MSRDGVAHDGGVGGLHPHGEDHHGAVCQEPQDEVRAGGRAAGIYCQGGIR